jgi:hypothetical protein
MNTNRFQSQAPTRYKRRPAQYLGVSPLLWSGTAAIAAVLAVILYCLLTHRIPV